MIIQIQQTSLLIIACAVMWILVDKRNIDSIPYWQVAAITIPALVATLVLVVTTLIRIWSN